MILRRKIEKSSRSHKVSEIIRKAISTVLIKNELPLDKPFNFPVNVVNVEMNSDLKIAYIYVTSNEYFQDSDLIEKLKSCNYYLSKEVKKLISLKYSPKLVFRNYETLYKLNRIEKILNKKISDDL